MVDTKLIINELVEYNVTAKLIYSDNTVIIP